MEPINIPIEDFIRPFFDAGETVCLRVFDDRKGNVFKAQKLETEAGKIAAITNVLKKHNKQNRGIFFVINYGGHDDADITRINAQFVECDSMSIEEQYAQIEAFPLPPSLIVKTRKSLHIYWLMKDAKVEDFRRVQKRLVAQFNGDPACCNPSRVFRLPGFYHCKEEPVLVECLKYAPELRYTQAELEAVLPEVSEKPVVKSISPSSPSSRKGLALVGKRCLFIQYCKENAKTLPEPLWYAMISNLAVFEGGVHAIHVLSKEYPKYRHSQTQNKITQFLKSGTKPMTCSKIAEFGFKCERLDGNVCGCKSPAALCYKPLNVEELRHFLEQCEVKGVAMDKIQAAKDFISSFLYNIEPVIGETFIYYEIKEHFRFKTSDIKPLITLHKELYKKYTNSKQTRRETDGAELPDWYEPTERGELRFMPGLLADHMAKNVAAFYGTGSYYFYDNGVYEPQEDLAAFAAVRSFMISKTSKSVEIGDAEKQWRSAIRKDVREININPFIINVKNGLYNVLDGSLKQHTIEYYSTVQINANYTKDARCPKFLDFLSGILPESELPLIQEIFGYLLIPVNKAQKSFVFVGASNAGKSTLLSIAQDVLLGSNNVSNIPWQGLSDRFNKAELFGKLANIFADLPSKAIDDGGMFKALTGEDSISAERKNRDPFNFRPYARLLFSCNEIPKNYSDRSDGFYRRLIIVRFDISVPQEKRDPNLRERVATESDGIFVWALEGLQRLIKNNYVFSETDRTRNEVTRYKVECNSALTFVTEYCEVGNGWITREELYSKYKDFCISDGYKAMSQSNFNKEIEGNYPEVTRGQDRVTWRKVWRGISFIDGGK